MRRPLRGRCPSSAQYLLTGPRGGLVARRGDAVAASPKSSGV
ncbi:hypothetical protein Ae150APs1_0269c [Pseudonocardia sp. Ae150A_Ps1]|nr:hypothetical protein Ae150APs1_0269c [Pseudonocardia sp. Ae150A_Ps1]